ncbi:unnamed protein product [Effrenium voratum]|nr:unnamed protein product [Effrenium voratum]
MVREAVSREVLVICALTEDSSVIHSSAVPRSLFGANTRGVKRAHGPAALWRWGLGQKPRKRGLCKVAARSRVCKAAAQHLVTRLPPDGALHSLCKIWMSADLGLVLAGPSSPRQKPACCSRLNFQLALIGLIPKQFLVHARGFSSRCSDGLVLTRGQILLEARTAFCNANSCFCNSSGSWMLQATCGQDACHIDSGFFICMKHQLVARLWNVAAGLASSCKKPALHALQGTEKHSCPWPWEILFAPCNLGSVCVIPFLHVAGTA